MAVTAVFQADFTSFDTAVKGADAQLRTFEGTSRTTEKSLQQMSVAATANVAPSQQIATTYKQFDGILASMGINIGPQVKGLEDLAAAATKGTGALGALGTASTVAAAAFVGWELGSKIRDLLGTDEAIRKLTTSLGLYNDVAGETAAAKQDTVNRAIAQGAKETISYTEAIKFNEEAMKRHVAGNIDWTAKLAAAQAEVRGLSTAEKDAIAIAQQAGATQEQLTAKYGISKEGLRALADQKKVTADQSAKLTAAHEKEAAAAAKLDIEYAKLMSDTKNAAGVAQMEADALALKTEKMNALIPMFAGLAKATAEQKAQSAALADQEQMLAADYDATVVAAQAMGEAHTEAGAAATSATSATVAGYQQVSQQVQLTSDNVRAMIALNQYTVRANAILGENSLYTTASQLQRIGNLPIPSFQEGISNFGGGLAKVHAGELLMNLSKGTSVLPPGLSAFVSQMMSGGGGGGLGDLFGGGGGGGGGLGSLLSGLMGGGSSIIPTGLGGGITIVNNTFNLSGSDEALARRVSDEIMRTIRAGTQLGTA